MDSFVIRSCREEDIPALCRLWKEEFGDSEELVRTFFRLLPEIGIGCTAVCDGEPVAAAYAITDMAYVSPDCSLPAAYLYAVATAPAFRGRGIATALCRECNRLAKEVGAEALIVEPAEDGLFDFYRRAVNTGFYYSRKTNTVSAGNGPHYVPVPVSPEAYFKLREQAMKDIPHLQISAKCLAYEKALCRQEGGDLYAFEGGCAAAYPDERKLMIKELLCGGPQSAAADLAAALGTDCAVYSVPSPVDGHRFLASDSPAFAENTLWNILFD